MAAAFALFAARFDTRVTLRTHDLAAMAALLAVPRDEDEPVTVNAAVELAGLGRPPRTPVVVDDAGRDDNTDDDGATRIMVLRPCYLALDAAVESLSRQRPPDSLLVVAEPHRALGPNDLADALCAPVAAVVPLDPEVARAVDSGLRGALVRARTPRSLQPLLDLVGRLLAFGEPHPHDVTAASGSGFKGAPDD